MAIECVKMSCSMVLMFVSVLCVGDLHASLSAELHDQLVAPATKPITFSVFSKRSAESCKWEAEVVMGDGADDPMKNGGWVVKVNRSAFDTPGAKQVIEVIASTSDVLQKASIGYDFFPKIGFYKFHVIGATWENARQTCAREGGHLAILNSEAESDALKKLFADHPSLGGDEASAFIGFNDQKTEGEYVTLFGKSLQDSGFTRWSTIRAQPDDGGGGAGGEDCGAVHRNGGLNDYPCDAVAPFFCEIGLDLEFWSKPFGGIESTTVSTSKETPKEETTPEVESTTVSTSSKETPKEETIAEVDSTTVSTSSKETPKEETIAEVEGTTVSTSKEIPKEETTPEVESTTVSTSNKETEVVTTDATTQSTTTSYDFVTVVKVNYCSDNQFSNDSINADGKDGQCSNDLDIDLRSGFGGGN